MKVVRFILASVITASLLLGCETKMSAGISMERQQKYSRLAIVCAAKRNFNPEFAPLILEQARKRIFPLAFLEKVDCLDNVMVDTNSVPPTVQMDDFSSYDAIVVMSYHYESGHVYIDLDMIDTLSFERIWHYRFDSPDPEIKKRLLSQGLFTPEVIREKFYRL
ncbi:MAG: hypothetical protein JW715_02470 [Sedimentisphaerales bacterium]|nr:hypothetical protein [Sedimentisphaerales bacterium]